MTPGKTDEERQGIMNLVRIGRQIVNMDQVRVIHDDGEAGFRLHFDEGHRTEFKGDDARAFRIWLEANQDLVIASSRSTKHIP